MASLSFAEAREAYEKGGLSGIGFSLGDGDVALDLDKCRNPETGAIDIWAFDIFEPAQSYCELTPSGSGARVIGLGTGPKIHANLKVPCGAPDAHLEIYRRADRYVTVTGAQVEEYEHLEPAVIDPIVDALAIRFGSASKANGDARESKANGDAREHTAPPENLPLPDEVALDIRYMQALRDGVPAGRRSEVFHAVVCGLRDDNGLIPAQIETLMRRYPNGIAAKYTGRLRKIIDASWRKVGNEDHDVVRDGTGDIIARDIGLVLYEMPKRQPGGKCRFDLIPFDKITFSTAPAYLVKGLIPRVGLSIFWGPPKCGKSFLVFDIMMHVALGSANPRPNHRRRK